MEQNKDDDSHRAVVELVLRDPGVGPVTWANRTGDLCRAKREEGGEPLARAGILDEVEGKPGQYSGNESDEQRRNRGEAEEENRNDRNTCNRTTDDEDSRDRVGEPLI